MDTNDTSKWWYCSDCRLYGFTSYVNADGSGYLVCPDESVVQLDGYAGTSDDDLLTVCDAQCNDMGFSASNTTTVDTFAFYNDRR